MSRRCTFALLDFIVFMATYLTLHFAGAGFWALLIVPFALWNFWDGYTRHERY